MASACSASWVRRSRTLLRGGLGPVACDDAVDHRCPGLVCGPLEGDDPISELSVFADEMLEFSQASRGFSRCFPA